MYHTVPYRLKLSGVDIGLYKEIRVIRFALIMRALMLKYVNFYQKGEKEMPISFHQSEGVL